MPFNMIHTTTLDMGQKRLRFEHTGGDAVLVRCPCHRLQSELHVTLTKAQAEELLAPRWLRRNIDEILPDHAPAIREVFLSGTTPAEWDADMMRKMRSAKDYLALGYPSVDPVNLKTDPRIGGRQQMRPGLKL